MSQKIPRIGVACILQKNNKILIGTRAGSHSSGTKQLPGGHLDFGETLACCARRELLEETAISTLESSWTVDTLVENIWQEDQSLHYITIFMKCTLNDSDNQIPQLLEPEKCLDWTWYTIPEITQLSPLFRPLASYLIQKNYMTSS